MEMKRILIFTGKFPAAGEDTDGGSILIKTLIETLKNNCILDIAFTRTIRPEFMNISGVNNVFFETYKYRSADKFDRRLKNKEQLSAFLKNRIDNYDTVIITHCSKAFGIANLTAEQQKKIILFPMFLSLSYNRSGEFPPNEYIEEEKKALNSAERILTPSNSEKNDMIDIFGVDERKITVIPRGYSSLITPAIKTISGAVNLLYIASVKEQKNTAEAVMLLKKLADKGVDAALYLAGGCQNEKVLEECQQYIELHRLQNRVAFCGVLPQKELAALIHKAHINISVSGWETFGRGIFEGMAGGLPTVVYDRLECVKQYVNNGNGISFVKDSKEFLDELLRLCNDKEYYKAQSQKAAAAVEYLSEKAEREKLLRELI